MEMPNTQQVSLDLSLNAKHWISMRLFVQVNNLILSMGIKRKLYFFSISYDNGKKKSYRKSEILLNI